MKRFQGAIAVFIGAASYGILSTFVKQAYAAGFTLGEVVGIQVLLGVSMLWIIYFIYVLLVPKKQTYLKETKIWKIIVSGFATGLVSIIYYKCVALVPASIAIVLLMQFIWISPVINLLVFKQKPSNRQGFGIIGILLATVFATGLLEDSIQEINIQGIGYGLLAATAYSIFIIVNGKVGNDYPPIQKSALMITGACILIFLTLRPYHLLTLDVDIEIYSYGLLLSIFGTVIPPLFYAYGMPKIGISLGGIISAVELPVAVLMSYFILHEAVSVMQWTGIVFILLIIVWINTQRKKMANGG